MGSSHDEMYRDVFATNIAVLEKCPNKPGVHKPRPIGSGASPDRKLGNACLVAAAYAHMKKVMIEAQNLSHGAEGAADIIAIYFQKMMEIDSENIEEKKGICSTDGANGFGSMRCEQVQNGLDQFPPPKLAWMKTMFWRFHKSASILFYRTPDGILH